MDPQFSEFSYGFALSHEIVTRWRGSGITVAPSFPSLYQEGQAGGGYDVRWDLPGMPLILQFKISERMLRKSAGEWQHFDQPYYRFWIHGRRHSDQHDLLIALDDGTAEVYYAAPTIHEIVDLNRAFYVGAVQQASIFFRPSDIGTLPDDDAHLMAFLPHAQYGIRCSEPRRVPVGGEGLAFSETIRSHLSRRRIVDPAAYFEKVASMLEQRSARRGDVDAAAGVTRQRDWPLAVRAGYLARTVLGAELLWVVDEINLTDSDLQRLRRQQSV